MALFKANLHNVQEKGASFNTLGKLEIAEDVLEEIVQNALVHRDLLRPAPIRIFIFDNRVEIISPGALAGGLTEEDIRNGKTYQRNPFLAVFATNALHYKGIGSGIVRILAECPNIQLSNDDSAKEFKVTIWRTRQKDNSTRQKSQTTIQKDDFTRQKSQTTIQKSQTTRQKSQFTIQKGLRTNLAKVLNYLKEHPNATINEITNSIDGISLSGVKFIIGKLKEKGLLKRIGGRKLGEWQVQEQGTNEIRLGEEW